MRDVKQIAAARELHLIGMFLGLPTIDDLAFFRVDHGDFGRGPKADVKPGFGFVPSEPVGVEIGFEFDDGRRTIPIGVELGDRVIESVGDPKSAAVF